MGVTSRFAYRYPELGDETNVPLDLQELAEDVEDWTSRLFQCTSSTRPAGVPAGFMARETDTGLVIVYTGSTWNEFGTGGGGGGGSSGGGRFTAGSSAQSIPNTTSGAGSVVAFGTTGSPTPTLVTRTTHDTGHKFALTTAGAWACGATVRVASSTVAGEISASIWADLAGGTSFDYNVATVGGLREGVPRTLAPNRTTYLPAGTTVAVYVYNGTGSTRTLEPNSGAWVNLDLWLVG